MLSEKKKKKNYVYSSKSSKLVKHRGHGQKESVQKMFGVNAWEVTK